MPAGLSPRKVAAMRRALAALPVALVVGALSAGSPQTAADTKSAFPLLQDFAGAVNVPGSPLWNELGVGWGRQDFSWNEIEPSQNQWRFDKYDAMVLGVHKWGCQILPILCYTASWAVAEGAPNTAGAARVRDWEDFVDTTVERYGKPPYNLRYFQVWNEPTRKAGFWRGATDDEFFQRVYLPAAKIIKRHGCHVVFGGWPCSDGTARLIELMDKFEAWRWTDIVDIHYYGLPSMVRLYDHYVKTGKCAGIWQTEIGWHPFEEYLPNLYCRTLYWGLKQGWEFRDQFKLFWYAFWGAGPVGPKCLTYPAQDGNRPSPTHGVRMNTLNAILGSSRLAAFDAYELSPPLPFTVDEDIQSSQGFTCGDKTVIAFQVDEKTQAEHSHLDLRLTCANRPSGAVRWSSTGQKKELPLQTQGNEVVVRVPLSDMQAGTARNWGREVRYVVGYVEIK